jgi:hypothetical protein
MSATNLDMKQVLRESLKDIVIDEVPHLVLNPHQALMYRHPTFMEAVLG